MALFAVYIKVLLGKYVLCPLHGYQYDENLSGFNQYTIVFISKLKGICINISVISLG